MQSNFSHSASALETLFWCRKLSSTHRGGNTLFRFEDNPEEGMVFENLVKKQKIGYIPSETN